MDANRISTGRPAATLRPPGAASQPAAPGADPAAARFRVPAANVAPYTRRQALDAQAAVAASRPAHGPLRIAVKRLPGAQVAPPQAGAPDSGPAVRLLLTGPQAQLLSRVQAAPANTPQERLRLLKSLLAPGMLTTQSAPTIMVTLVKKLGLATVRDELLAPLIFAQSRAAIPRESLEACFDSLLDLRHAQVRTTGKGVTAAEVRVGGCNRNRDEPAAHG